MSVCSTNSRRMLSAIRWVRRGHFERESLARLNQSQIREKKISVELKSNFPPVFLPPRRLPVAAVGCCINNQNHFQLNNYVKIGLVDADASQATANMCPHRVPFPSIMENGWASNCFPSNFYSSPGFVGVDPKQLFKAGHVSTGEHYC